MRPLGRVGMRPGGRVRVRFPFGLRVTWPWIAGLGALASVLGVTRWFWFPRGSAGLAGLSTVGALTLVGGAIRPWPPSGLLPLSGWVPWPPLPRGPLTMARRAIRFARSVRLASVALVRGLLGFLRTGVALTGSGRPGGSVWMTTLFRGWWVGGLGFWGFGSCPGRLRSALLRKGPRWWFVSSSLIGVRAWRTALSARGPLAARHPAAARWTKGHWKTDALTGTISLASPFDTRARLLEGWTRPRGHGLY